MTRVPGGSEWGPIEVKCAVEMVVGQKLWIDLGDSQEVERYHRLWNQLVPKFEWKIGISTAEDRYEVIFPSAYGSFCCIAEICMGQYQL